jgi:uncharacterized protein (TIGR03067 family)
VTTWLVLASSFLFGWDQSAAEKEMAHLAGTWSFASVEVNGAKQPPVPFATNKMIISKDGIYIVVQGPRITYGTIKVDPSKSPGHYEPTVTSGPVKGQTFKGIYELDGDTLKTCLPLGKDRPSSFYREQSG